MKTLPALSLLIPIFSFYLALQQLRLIAVTREYCISIGSSECYTHMLASPPYLGPGSTLAQFTSSRTVKLALWKRKVKISEVPDG